MSDRVVTTIVDGVADVRLNRPEKLNALDPAMFAAIVEAGEVLKHEPGLRAVVLSGEGRSFCAGLDFSSFQAMAGDGAGEGGDTNSIGAVPEGRITHGGQQAVYVWQEVPVPVIAAVSGHALGGGFQLMLGADLRIVHPDAQLSVLEIRWGLVPDMCATQLLPPLIGHERARELTWTGRTMTGAEGVEIGLALRASDQPRDDALALARELATKSPDAVRAAKRLFGFDRGQLAAGFATERREIGALIGSANQKEAITAFFEKRAPQFR